MPQSFACLHFHFVFSTKQRSPLITPELQPRLYGYLGGLLRAQDGCLLAVDGIADHIHLLARLGRESSVAETMRVLKSNSSKWVHETFPLYTDFAWQTGYGAFTVSYSQIGTVKRYIANQDVHHRELSFQDEFRTLLRRHGIEFDERYLWD